MFHLQSEWYYYLHTNGKVIGRIAHTVDAGGGPREYFESDFVERWFLVESADDYLKMLCEKAMESEIERLEREADVTQSDYFRYEVDKATRFSRRE